jgi:two-component system phosphate regulon sensor histidine kinase PhoR
MDISADSTHLTNIITNLIENAIKYSGEEVSVKISAEQTTDYIAISIADTGYGISSAEKTKIFNRFYRGKASATDIPGMGLGLAYVKLLVDAHGGDISVKSSEGAGSTFTIKLPQ